MATVRHFTATALLIHNGCLALHWHSKVQAWLPPGGHIEENEDPVQAVLREVKEETGLTAEIVSTSHKFDLKYPAQVVPPITIMLEDIDDPMEGHHQHVDMIYICQPARLLNCTELKDGWLWVDCETLTNGTPLKRDNGIGITPPQDVVQLAKFAFRVVKDLSNKSA